jgi:tetratricopeptide (TPR) repeat protein
MAIDNWRELLFRIGWMQSRPEFVHDHGRQQRAARLARYERLRNEGLDLLAAGQLSEATEYLAAAATIGNTFWEAYLNLARAFEMAGKIEAARCVLDLGLESAERKEHRPAIAVFRRQQAALPKPPPARRYFIDGQQIHSPLTDTRWTVLGTPKLGGFGVVYKVRDHADGVVRGLKTLTTRVWWSDEDRDRFVREATSWIRLDRHPHIVSAEWIDTVEDCPVVVMEWLGGGDLHDALVKTRFDMTRVLDIAIQISDGMAFAHKTLGLVHRDLKPANCLLTANGRVKVGDFGLARNFLERRAAGFSLSTLNADVQATLTAAYGTMPYMAPEQRDPEAPLDARTDVHALGVMMYEMLGGELDRVEMADRIDRLSFANAVRQLSLPRSLADLILACVAPNPADRPRDFVEVRDGLARELTRRTGRPAPPVPEPAPVDVPSWNNKAVAFQALAKYEEAIECYDHALASAPRDPDLWLNKGAALLCLARHDEAIACFDEALRLQPEDGDTLNNKGRALFELGHIDAALECLGKAATLAPGDSTVCKNMAEALRRNGKPEEGLRWIERGLRIDPRNPALIELHGFALLAMGGIDEARAAFDRGLTIAPRRSGLWKGKTIVHERCSEMAEAAYSRLKELELTPGDGRQRDGV